MLVPHRALVSLLSAAAVVLGGLAVPAHAQEGRDQAVVVQLRPGAKLPATTSDALNKRGRLKRQYQKVFNGFAATLSAEDIAALKADPNVLRVVHDDEVTTSETQVNPPSWGLDRLDQRALPVDNAYTYDTTGVGVSVFILDSGVRASHADFGGRVIGGRDFVDNDDDPADCNGHGTHVAGTVAGTAAGVAKEATIVPVRIVGCDGGGSVSTALAGLDWVIAHKPVGPSVVNFSIGTPGVNSLLDVAAAKVVASGIPFIAAAGNDATDACTRSPARAPDVLTVGATDSQDVAAYYSNYGDCVDLFAPGSFITSNWVRSDVDMVSLSGTSMAAPHVAGVAARYLQSNRAATPQTVADFLATTASRVVTGARSTNDRLLNVDGGPPTPVQPTPVEPTPVEPTPVEPTPVEATPVPPTLPTEPPEPAQRSSPAPEPVPAAVVPEPTPTTTPPPAAAIVAPPTSSESPPAQTPSATPALPRSVVPPVDRRIKITQIYYNARGRDSRANLNGEWVKITNTGSRTVWLTGYTLRDASNRVYRFPRTRLGAGRSLKVYSGRVAETTSSRGWRSATHIWNNAGRESARLRDSRGRAVSSRYWISRRVGVIRFR